VAKTRLLSNFLRAYMEFTRDTESPDAFHFWSCATVIGAATRRQVLFDMAFFRIYPNLFTFLVGPSGARKSVAAEIAMELGESIGIKKFADRITGAKLAEDLANTNYKRINPKTNEVTITSPMMIYASELGVFLGADAYKSGTISDLTDLYDCRPKWTKSTKMHGTNEVIAPYITMLAGTTPQTLKDVIPYNAIGQGFTSRVCFVWGPGRRKRVPVPEWGPGQDFMKKSLIEDLSHIAELEGKFRFSQEGRTTYDKYYMSRPEAEEEFEDERLRGYSSRKDIYLIKLGMILSLARNDSLILEKEDMDGAAEVLNWMDQGLPNVFAAIGRSAISEDVVRVLKQIEQATLKLGFATHSEILKRNYHQLNASEFAIVIETLRQSDAIEEILTRSPANKVMKVYKFISAEPLTRIVNTPKPAKEE